MSHRLRDASDEVDWLAIRERLRALARVIDGEAAADPEAAARVLEERAAALARPAAPLHETAEAELVVVSAGGQRYALEAVYVFEVFRPVELAYLPAVEPPTVGVVGWRGDLLAVLDLRQALGLASPSSDGLERVVVLGVGRPAFGLLVEAVHEVREFTPGTLRPVPEEVAEGGTHLRGVTEDAVLVLDAPTLVETYS